MAAELLFSRRGGRLLDEAQLRVLRDVGARRPSIADFIKPVRE